MKRSLPCFVALLTLIGCQGSGGEGVPSEPSSAKSAVEVIVVNYEIVAESTNRFMAGLITQDGRSIAYGSVQMRFARDTGGPLEASDAVAGRYLAVPGTATEPGRDDPLAIRPSSARGVYAVEGVRFLQAGTYVVEVAAQVEGLGVVQGSSRFDVLPEPLVPGLGEPAPKTRNHTLGEAGVPEVAIDSRATDGDIPDALLHRTTIARSIERGRPALVVFSTPVFCVSRFCGPVTDVVEELAADNADKGIDFIHIEIWRDFEANTINEAAADWLLQEGALNEPWAFLIDGDGKIAARWDNLFTEDELRAGLETVR